MTLTPADLAILARITDDRWPIAVLETLILGWRAGDTTAVIGAACGKSSNAVIGKASRLRKRGVAMPSRPSPIVRSAAPKAAPPAPSGAATLPPLASMAVSLETAPARKRPAPSHAEAATRMEFTEMWDAGAPQRSIAGRFNISTDAVWRWRRRFKLAPRLGPRGVAAGTGAHVPMLSPGAAYLLTPQGIAAFTEARQSGESDYALAARFDVPRSRVARMRTALGLPPSGRGPAAAGGRAGFEAAFERAARVSGLNPPRPLPLAPEPSAAILRPSADEREPPPVEAGDAEPDTAAVEWHARSYARSGPRQCQYMAAEWTGLGTLVCGEPVRAPGEPWCAKCRGKLLVRVADRREAYVAPSRSWMFAGHV